MALIVHMSYIAFLASCMLDTSPAIVLMTSHCSKSCLEQIVNLEILRENTSVPFD